MAPTITTQPASQTVARGLAATFTVATTGDAPLSYQWQRNGVDVAQATAASYTLPAAQAVDGGSTWRVVVRNAAGTVTSNSATLTVAVGSISLLAGSVGGAGNLDGLGELARFGDANGMVVDGAGKLYLADTDNQTIRKITPAGLVSTIAGHRGITPAVDGTGTAASFVAPLGLAMDAAGTLYVTDWNAIRKVSPTGVVTTLAGGLGFDDHDSSSGYRDGVGTQARFNDPRGISVDGAGNVYVADRGNNAVRKITPAGVVSTLAGGGPFLDPPRDGTGADARFSGPVALALDAAGNVYVNDSATGALRKVTPAGVVTTVGNAAGVRSTSSNGMAADATGNIYVIEAGTVRVVTQAGVVTTVASTQSGHGLALDAAGNLYLTDGFAIRKVTPAGVESTLAGNTAPNSLEAKDGTGAVASFPHVTGLTVDGGGNVYLTYLSGPIFDPPYPGKVRKITPAGVTTTLTGTAAATADINGPCAQATFLSPKSPAADSAGNLYVADAGNALIRKITPDCVVSTLAGSQGVRGQQDGTGTAATFNGISGIAADAAGNLYVSDISLNGVSLRKVSPAGVVTTLTSIGNIPGITQVLVAVDASGNAYLTVSIFNNPETKLIKLTPGGVLSVLSTLAGVTAPPSGMVVDKKGNLYVSSLNDGGVIRMITPGGAVAIVAGQPGSIGTLLGDLPGSLSGISGLGIDNQGVLYVASGNAVLKIRLP